MCLFTQIHISTVDSTFKLNTAVSNAGDFETKMYYLMCYRLYMTEKVK